VAVARGTSPFTIMVVRGQSVSRVHTDPLQASDATWRARLPGGPNQVHIGTARADTALQIGPSEKGLMIQFAITRFMMLVRWVHSWECPSGNPCCTQDKRCAECLDYMFR